MFERFTDRARRVVVEAQQEARLLRHHYIGTEHLLLGLLSEGQGMAAVSLEALGLSLDQVRERVSEIVGESAARQPPEGHIPFTPPAKKTLEQSLREALKLGDNHIGTEHILLALVAQGDGVAFQVLTELGADDKRVRQQVMRVRALHTAAVESRPVPGPGHAQSAGSPGRRTLGPPGLFARLDALEYKVAGLSAEVDRLRELVTQQEIDSGEADSGEAATD
jgi:ATP-dependent Clp protease ATP-binding subunit ClpC